MHREDNSNYFLFIEPKREDKLTEPIDDDITQFMQMLLDEESMQEGLWYRTKEGGSNYSNPHDNGDKFNEGIRWRGWHTTECGELSSNKDYQLFNGLITNSLAPFYLRWYRNSIPKSEWIKYKQLTDDFKELSLKNQFSV